MAQTASAARHRQGRPVVRRCHELGSKPSQGIVDFDRTVLYERILPALPLSVGRVRAELTHALAVHGLAEDRRADIALVVTEATTNAVLHAYRDDSPGPLYVAAALVRGSLITSVVDRGAGVLLHPESPGLGMGRMLMTRVADDVRLLSDRATGGTCVEATFHDVAARRGAVSPEAGRGELLHEYVRALRMANAAIREDATAAD